MAPPPGGRGTRRPPSESSQAESDALPKIKNVPTHGLATSTWTKALLREAPNFEPLVFGARSEIETPVKTLRPFSIALKRMKHLLWRYRADHHDDCHVWEMMEMNAGSAALNKRRAESRMGSALAVDPDADPELLRRIQKAAPASRELPIYVVLVMQHPCSPPTFALIEILQRARAAIEALPGTSVVGALIVPESSDGMTAKGQPELRNFPFTLRVSMTREVVQMAGQASWIGVDRCLETGLDQAPEPMVSYVGRYARSRLQNIHWKVRTVEVLIEDPIYGNSMAERPTVLRVPQARAKKHEGLVHKIEQVHAVLVESSGLAEMENVVRTAMSRLEVADSSAMALLNKLCGATTTSEIASWIAQRSRTLKRGAVAKFADRLHAARS